MAFAQEARRIAIVNVSRSVEEFTATGHPMYAAFHDELARRGYVEGGNLVIERWSGRDRADREALAREVVASAPDLIFAASGAAIGPHLKRATDTIPIVFLGHDPVRYGLVSNLARPGGNITGIASDPGVEFEGKKLELLLRAVPAAARVAYLNASWTWAETEPRLAEAASILGVAIVPVILEVPVSEAAYREAFVTMESLGVDALLVGGSIESNTFARLIAELALAARLPAGYAIRDFTDSGGLMSYGIDCPAEMRRCAAYVARILNGEAPGELPVRQPVSYELILNLTTAQALGLTMPPALLIQATELIE